MRAGQLFLNRSHYIKSPQFKAQAVKAARAAHAARVPEQIKLERLGKLSARELEIYRRGHHNGYATGYDMGRRKGYAEALAEGEEITWVRKGTHAARMMNAEKRSCTARAGVS
jgi:flagellar biosynthesis/type III secretory pathway protein FliH